MIELVADLQARLEAQSLAEKRRWWERYLKGQAAFRGVPMGAVRAAVHSWCADYGLGGALSRGEQLTLVGALISQRHTEDKLAGTILLTEVLIPNGRVSCESALPHFAAYFDAGHLSDWNAVDWFCVKALCTLVEAEGADCGRRILNWASAENLWRARASVVTFANVSSRGDRVFPGFATGLLQACNTLIRRPERFAKTGVGWVLRGLAESEVTRVTEFIDQHLAHFSSEALKSAVRRMSPHAAAELTRRHKAVGPAPVH